MGICNSLVLQSYSSNIQEMYDLTINNHVRYCAAQNCSLLCKNEQWTGLNNFDDVIAYLHVFDSVITVGTDCVFTNFSKNFNDFTGDFPITISQETEFSTRCGTPANGEIIIFRKTPNCDVFKLLYQLKSLQNALIEQSKHDDVIKRLLGAGHDFHSQALFCFIYLFEQFSEFRKYVNYVITGEMQSFVQKYVSHPLIERENWKAGKFLVHMFSRSNEEKVKNIREFLNDHPEYR